MEKIPKAVLKEVIKMAQSNGKSLWKNLLWYYEKSAEQVLVVAHRASNSKDRVRLSGSAPKKRKAKKSCESIIYTKTTTKRNQKRRKPKV